MLQLALLLCLFLPRFLRFLQGAHPVSPLCVKQFQYTGWPDHGVPLQPSSLVKFIQQVRKEVEGTDAPIVVHCR